MACGDGEEAHLAALAAGFDARIEEMRQSFGEIGDMRLHVMAALTVSDELAELRRRLDAQEAELVSLRAAEASVEAVRAADQTRLAESITDTAERIERLARALSSLKISVDDWK